MLNEERIKLMTKLAIYEENEGKKKLVIGSYFRRDYVGLQITKSILYATVAYLILVGMFLHYDFENVMQEMYRMDLLHLGRNLLFLYLVFVGVYALIAYIVYSLRYNNAKKSLRRYYYDLRSLAAYHEMEEQKNEERKDRNPPFQEL